jgi:hypothetical protein
MANLLPPVPQITKDGLASPVWAKWLSALRVQTGQPNWVSVVNTPTNATGYGITSIDGVPIGQSAAAVGTFSSLTSNGSVFAARNLSSETVGYGLTIKEGTNAKQGTAVLVAGTIAVVNSSITANSRIFLSNQLSSGTPGALYVASRTIGSGFTVTSTSTTDTSTIAYLITEPS